MSKKKKQAEVDQRSAIEIEIDNVQAEITRTEGQILYCRDSLAELATHTAKIKQLEQDIGPKEVEHKSILSSFHKVLDQASNINKKLPGAADEHDTGGHHPAASRPQSRLETSHGTRGADKDASQISTADENKDKELMKHLHHAVKESLQAIFVPIFNLPKTPAELAIEKEKEREAAERLAAEGGASPGVKPPGSAQGARKPPPKSGAAGGEKVAADVHMQCPPGIEPSYFEDVLKLRTQRLANEAKLHVLQQQLTQSRQIVVKRRDEGISKGALKKNEKRLIQLQRQIQDLTKIKQEQDAHKARQAELAGTTTDKKKKK